MIPDDDNDRTVEAQRGPREDAGIRGFFLQKAKEAGECAATALDSQSKDTWLTIADGFRSAAGVDAGPKR